MRFDVLTMEEFDQYYDILENHFPGKEVKEYHYLKGLFESKTAKAITLKDNNRIIGVLSYFDLQDLLFVDYFAILEEYQGQRLGQKMLTYFKEYSKVPFVLEVEHPTDEQSIRRIAFYKREGLYLNEHEYVVPEMIGISEELRFLLMSYPNSIKEEEYPSMYQRILDEVYQIYKYQ